MSKYTPPPVTIHDVVAALPTVEMPLSLRLMLVPTKNSPRDVYVCVELVHYGLKGEAYVYKRWGRDVRAQDTLRVMQVALLAAQEAYLFLEGKDLAELKRFIEWQLGIPYHLG